ALFVRTKSEPGCGAGEARRKRTRGRSPRKLPNRKAVPGKEKYLSPTRPATRESEPIGALRWHRPIKKDRGPPSGGPPRSSCHEFFHLVQQGAEHVQGVLRRLRAGHGPPGALQRVSPALGPA